jgi:hypothetical protein
MDVYTLREIVLWTLYIIGAVTLLFDVIYISHIIMARIKYIATTTKDQRIYDWLNEQNPTTTQRSYRI